MLKIYGADLSSPANKVRMAANELKLSYEYIRISVRDGENRTESFLKMHPAGKIPVIDDDGFILFESDAIVKYLSQKAGSALYPQDLRQRALVDQWMDFTAIHIGNAMGRVVYNRVFAPRLHGRSDESAIEEGLGFLKKFLPVVDQELARHSYLAGKALTLADIALAATLDPAEVADIDLRSYAALARWRSAIQQKEFYTKCHSHYGAALNAVFSKK